MKNVSNENVLLKQRPNLFSKPDAKQYIYNKKTKYLFWY